MTQSQENLDQGSTATNHTTELSSDAQNLLQQYMHKLKALTSSELQEFSYLVQASASQMPFPDFCAKVFELFGPDRKYLLSGLSPFIPYKDSNYFETFLEHVGVNGN